MIEMSHGSIGDPLSNRGELNDIIEIRPSLVKMSARWNVELNSSAHAGFIAQNPREFARF